jgi:hypothetical protein
VQAQVRNHSVPTDPNSSLAGQIGATLRFSGPFPSGIIGGGQVGVAATATSAVVDSSIANAPFGP